MSDGVAETAVRQEIEAAAATAAPKLAVKALSEDKSVQDGQFTHQKWERLSTQRDTLINAVIRVFTWLNGGVYLLVLLAWIAGHFSNYRIVDGNTLMALVGATVVQAGLAFAAIVKFLFPATSDE
jgi:hypothetical protein